MCSALRANFKNFVYLLATAAIGLYALYSLSGLQANHYTIVPSTTKFLSINKLSPMYENGRTKLHGRHVKNIWLEPAKQASLPAEFQPDMLVVEVDILLNLLRKFVSVAEQKRWSYFLMGSSLLGAYRHHGLVPWEGEATIALDVKHKAALLSQALKLLPTYHMFEVKSESNFSLNSMKFYSIYSEKVPGKDYRYPYLEINFFHSKPDHILVNNGPVDYNTIIRLQKSWIFPLGSLPLWNVYISAPRRTKKVLETEWDLRMCNSKRFDPRRDVLLPREQKTQVLCTALWDQFPFTIQQKLTNISVKHNQVLWKHKDFVTAL